MKIIWFCTTLFNIIFKFIISWLGSPIFWWQVIFVLLVVFIINLFFMHRKYRATSININLPFSLGNITYEASSLDRIIAWKLYVQLKTRKAALMFDEEYDLIAEVYDSLYELFSIMRDLLTDLPLEEVERRNNVADLILRVTNDGLRPHLTKWQADFKRWWERAIDNSNNGDKTPQNIQKEYPRYKELIIELKQMNVELNKYAENLLDIAKTPYRWRYKKSGFYKKVVIPPQIEKVVK